MINSSIEAELNKNGTLVYTNVGDSMFPLIRSNGDLIVIKKHNGPFKKYDVPLYKRESGQYVLHRVLKVKKDGSYVICGDNRFSKEYGITDKNMLGILHSVIRNGKEIKTTDVKYKIYSHIWCDFFLIRSLILIIKRIIKGK